jgi:hypothetical protein
MLYAFLVFIWNKAGQFLQNNMNCFFAKIQKKWKDIEGLAIN